MGVGRILFDNLIRNDEGTVFSVYNNADFPAENCVDGRTNTYIVGSGTWDFDIDWPVVHSFDTFCMSRHNFASFSGSQVEVFGTDASKVTYTSLTDGPVDVTSTKNLFIDLGPQNYQYIKVRFITPGGIGQLSDLSIGPCVPLQRSQNFGFVRPGFADGDRIVANVTRGQEFVGMTIERGLQNVKFNLPYYNESWITDASSGGWLALRDSMKKYPIYIIWDETRNEGPFSGEPAFYCWPKDKVPEPKYSKNIIGYYDIAMDMVGFWE